MTVIDDSILTDSLKGRVGSGWDIEVTSISGSCLNCSFQGVIRNQLLVRKHSVGLGATVTLLKPGFNIYSLIADAHQKAKKVGNTKDQHVHTLSAF